MRNLSSIFSFKNRSTTDALWIFVFAVIALESAFACLPQSALINSVRALKSPAVAPDLQIMGDSVAAGGLLPQVISAAPHSQTNIANVAIPGTDAEFPYFQLQRQIQEGRPPGAVLLALSPQVLLEDRISLLVGAYCTAAEVLEVVRTGIAPDEVTYGLLCRLSYTLRYRQNIAGFLLGRGFDGKSMLRDQLENAVAGQAFTSTAKPKYPFNPDGSFSVSRFNQHYLEKFLALCARQKIRVYWLMMPTSKDLYDRRLKSGYVRDYYRWVGQYQSTRQIVPLNSTFVLLPETDFLDGVHLTPAGATKFSGLVNEMLRTATAKSNSRNP